MYGRTPTTETKNYDHQGRATGGEEVVILGVGEATRLQQALETSPDPAVQEALAWLAHTIGAVDSVNLEIRITRTWG